MPRPNRNPRPRLEIKPAANGKTSSDLTPQIATRAYELYEQEGRQDGQSVQDWEKAEREIRKDETKTEPKPEAKAAEPKPDAKAAEPKPDAKATEPKPDAKATEPKPEPKQPSLSPMPKRPSQSPMPKQRA